jgi:hypothetical protein
MSEMAEIWGDLRQIRQEKKRSNLAASTKILQQKNIPFVSNNGGIHLVLRRGEQFIDYWPSTGLWWIRGTSHKRRGITRLLAYINARTL